MWMKNKTLILLFILFISGSALAQDPVFTSFMHNPLYYNPATPGIKSGNEFHLNYREQWPGIPGGNRAFSYSSTHVFCSNFSLGLIANSAHEGESKMTTNSMGLSVAVPIRIADRLRLSTGITTAYGQKRIDWNELDFDDEYDKLYGKIYNTGFPFPGNSRKNYGDVSLGMALQGTSKRKPFKPQLTGVVGAAYHHAAVVPDPNFIGSNVNAVPLKQVYHMNLWILYGHKKKQGVSPALMYEKQGPMETFNFSLSYLIDQFYALGGFRNRNYKLATNNYESFLLGFGFISDINPSNRSSFKFGYSYDFTLSKLAEGSFGTHEIFIVYNLKGCNSLASLFSGDKYNRVRKPDKECEQFQFDGRLYW